MNINRFSIRASAWALTAIGLSMSIAQAAPRAKVPGPMLAVNSQSLDTAELSQLRGAQLNEVLLNLTPLLDLTQAYRSHRNLIVDTGSSGVATDSRGTSYLLTVITQ